MSGQALHPLFERTDLEMLLDAAKPAPRGHFDALRCAAGGVQADLAAPWRQFFRALPQPTAAEFDRLSASVARRVRDNGITYNVYADENSLARPWSLDLFPLLLDAATWARLEAGIAQRALLLNTIVVDAYGEQRLVRDGVLPPALIFGHPGYARAMHGYQPPDGVWLPIQAFDLSCDADGNWWVVSQRTQAPSGLGYLLENRLIISAQFPDSFAALQIRRVGDSYRQLMAGLLARSPRGERSRAVLLTPGPYNETYFEHVYLARSLGLTLAEGADLLVRDNQLYLKTLEGLEPVDIVLRRLDDDFCDPLELRADSALGVPGLLQAIKAGNVLVANAPGSGFLESPGILGFLPPLAETLLGETLQLPSLPTWWCGEAAVREQMLGQLADSIVKPTWPNQNFEPIPGHLMQPAELAALAARIESAPEAHCVQQNLPMMHVPVWEKRQIAQRACLLRVYALHDGKQWQVLPGGLARIAAPGSGSVSMQRGGSSVDVWVAGGAPAQPTAPLHAPLTLAEIASRHQPVGSRAAEHLFWMGRYAERAENATRLARLTLEWLNGEYKLSSGVAQWLAEIDEEHGLITAGVPTPDIAPRIFERALIMGLPGNERCAGIGGTLEALARNAYPLRHRLPIEHWQLLVDAASQFRQQLAAALRRSARVPAALEVLETLDIRLVAITGSQNDRMTRDNGWRLMNIGRHIERLSTLSGLLRCAVEHRLIDDSAAFNFVLAGFDSSITYRSEYQGRIELLPLLDLLVFDTDNPRSLTWVLGTIRARLAKLCVGAPHLASRLLLKLPDPQQWNLGQLASAEHGMPGFDAPPLAALADMLGQCQQSAWDLSDEIGQLFFSHAHDQHQQVSA